MAFSASLPAMPRLRLPHACVLLAALLSVQPGRAAPVSPLMTAADTAVADATTPMEKINALYRRARVPQQLDHATREQWEKALVDLNAALGLVADYEKTSRAPVAGKGAIFFEKGSTLGELDRHEEAIAAYDQAEASNYFASYARQETKGAELFINRGLQKELQDDLIGALADFNAALKRATRSSWLKARARIEFKLGDGMASGADWIQAVQLDGDIADWPYDVDQLPFNKAVADHPKDAAPLIARAHFTLKRGLEASARGHTAADTLLDKLAAAGAGSEGTEVFEKPLAELDHAIQLDPNSADAWLERGRTRLLFLKVYSFVLYLRTDFDQAISDFNHALTLAPDNAAAWYELGYAHVQHLAQAKKEAADRSTELTAEERAADVGPAEAAFSQAIFLRPEASGLAHFQRATLERQQPHPDAHALEVDYTAAIQQALSPMDADWAAVQRLTGAEPDHPLLDEAHFILARILLSQGRQNAALEHLNAAALHNITARFERGKLLVQRGEYTAALTDLDQVVSAHAELAEAWAWRAMAHDGAREIELARADLARASAFDKAMATRLRGTRYAAENPDPARGIAPPPHRDDTRASRTGTALEHKDAGNAHRQKGDIDRALAEYTTAVEIDPAFADGYNNRAAIYSGKGFIDLALADFAQAIANDPHHRVAYLGRAAVWHILNKPELEKADLTLGIAYAPNDSIRASGYSARGELFEAQGDSDAALADAKQAAELDPQTARAYRIAGRVLLDRGEVEDSISYFHGALSIDADDIGTRFNLSVALAFTGDDSAITEFDTVLTKSSPAQRAKFRELLALSSEKHPESTQLKTMTARSALKD